MRTRFWGWLDDWIDGKEKYFYHQFWGIHFLENYREKTWRLTDSQITFLALNHLIVLKLDGDQKMLSALGRSEKAFWNKTSVVGRCGSSHKVDWFCDNKLKLLFKQTKKAEIFVSAFQVHKKIPLKAVQLPRVWVTDPPPLVPVEPVPLPPRFLSPPA